MALSSSDGLLWGNGPMRVGGLGSTDCLAPGSMFVPKEFFVKNTKNNIIIKVLKQQRFPLLLGQVLVARLWVWQLESWPMFYSSESGGGDRDLHPRIISQVNTSLQQNRIKRHQSFPPLSLRRWHHNVHTSIFCHQLRILNHRRQLHWDSVDHPHTLLLYLLCQIQHHSQTIHPGQ